ncbi:hypothetical protein C3H94_02555 [Campylobacter jejuni]|uniref:hypothetical protein n=1 Tax=Campylobacter jejuni TaxID=197 RepID=UPI000F808809|nr:hypothetical protein [Campylobacter jejuni]RTJ08431.1 hypothetical protein C3H94_02555 [Campylobacter jejuni]
MPKYKWNEMDDSRIKALLKPAFSGGERFSYREHFKIVLTPELEDFFDFWKIKSSKDYEDRLFNEWWFNKARKWGLPSLLHSSRKKIIQFSSIKILILLILFMIVVIRLQVI